MALHFKALLNKIFPQKHLFVGKPECQNKAAAASIQPAAFSEGFGQTQS
jgi:hypothetical protein